MTKVLLGMRQWYTVVIYFYNDLYAGTLVHCGYVQIDCLGTSIPSQNFREAVELAEVLGKYFQD